MSNMNPEDVVLSTPMSDGDGPLPPGHPAGRDSTTDAGEALSKPGSVVEPGAGDDTHG